MCCKTFQSQKPKLQPIFQDFFLSPKNQVLKKICCLHCNMSNGYLVAINITLLTTLLFSKNT